MLGGKLKIEAMPSSSLFNASVLILRVCCQTVRVDVPCYLIA
jgi:hypothetical protein